MHAILGKSTVDLGCRGQNKVLSGHYVLAILMLSGHLQSVMMCMSQSSNLYIPVHSSTITVIVTEYNLTQEKFLRKQRWYY